MVNATSNIMYLIEYDLERMKYIGNDAFIDVSIHIRSSNGNLEPNVMDNVIIVLKRFKNSNRLIEYDLLNFNLFLVISRILAAR